MPEDNPQDYNVSNGRYEMMDYTGEEPVKKVIAKNFQMKLDERGIPQDLNEEGTAAPHCPLRPCALCTGFAQVLNSDGVPMTSWEWCQEVDTCAATVDWEKVYGR